MGKFGKYTAYAIGVVLNLVLFCFVMSQLWLWFIVPLGFPALSAVQAYGLLLIIVLFKSRNIRPLKREFYAEKKFGVQISLGILFSLVAWLFGWVATLLM